MWRVPLCAMVICVMFAQCQTETKTAGMDGPGGHMKLHGIVRSLGLDAR